MAFQSPDLESSCTFLWQGSKTEEKEQEVPKILNLDLSFDYLKSDSNTDVETFKASFEFSDIEVSFFFIKSIWRT